jgi:tetratricopeptide (TPR) repeat protein
MSEEKEHPVAGILWLALVTAALAFGAKSGIQGSKRAALRNEVREAVEAGERGEYLRAEELLRDVLREEPNDVDALFNLGVADVALDKLDEADEAFTKVLEKNPNDWDALAERATLAERKGKTDEALKTLDRIPEGQGHMTDRLQNEVAWAKLDGDPRMNKIREKHGLPPLDRPAPKPTPHLENPPQ